MRSLRSRDLRVAALSESQIYGDYERAFKGGTGLPLTLHEPEMFRLVQYSSQGESPFCSLMGKTHKTCAACYALQQNLGQIAGLEAKTLTCFAGLCESAVPVRVGGDLIALLHTGQVLLQQPTRRRFNRVAATLLKWGIEVDVQSAKEAYFQTRVMSPAQYESLIRLLTIFAGHLATIGDELLLRANAGEPVAVVKARRFVDAHHAEELSLSRVARAVNASATYLPGACAGRESKESSAESKPSHQRDRFGGGLPIGLPIQSHIQKGHRPVAEATAAKTVIASSSELKCRGISWCSSSILLGHPLL